MAIINQSNILNLQPGITAPVVVHMSEGDSGTKLSFKLIDGARAWTDPGNVVAAVHGRRQDGTQFGPYACTISGDVVSFQTDAAIAAVAGSGIAQIVLTDSDGNSAGSANFAVMVERATFPTGVTYTNDVSVYEAILAYVQTIPAQVTEDYTTGIAAEAIAREAADTALKTNIDAVQGALSAEISDRTTQDAVLSARMDEFTKLPDGSLSTAADAELVDIRIKADGTTAATAGDAVREQITELKNELKILGISSFTKVSGVNHPDANDRITGLNIPSGTKFVLTVERPTTNWIYFYAHDSNGTSNMIKDTNLASGEFEITAPFDIFSIGLTDPSNTTSGLYTFTILAIDSAIYLAEQAYPIATKNKSDIDNYCVCKNIIGSEPNILYPCDVHNGDALTVSTATGEPVPNGDVQIRFYDANKQFVTYWGFWKDQTSRTFTYNNATDAKYVAYIRYDGVLQLEKGNAKTSYQEYFLDSKKITSEVAEEKYRYVLNGLDVLSGTLIEGTPDVNNSRIFTRMFSVDEGDYIAFDNTSNTKLRYMIVYYDDNGDYISTSAWIQELTVFTTYQHIRIVIGTYDYSEIPQTDIENVARTLTLFLSIANGIRGVSGEIYVPKIDHEHDTETQNFAKKFLGTGKATSFIYFTDPHILSSGEKSAFYDKFTSYTELIGEYFDKTATSFVLCGGDWLEWTDTPSLALWKLNLMTGRMKELFGTRYYPTFGNHDNNYQGTEEDGVKALSKDIIRDVMFPYWDNTYYSFSMPEARFYVLDSGTDWDSTMAGDATRWTQVDWFANQLLENDDAHSAVCIHILWNVNADTEVAPFADNILKVIEAYNNKTTVTLNGITYNFANCVGKVGFVIGGHLHEDRADTTNYAVPVITTRNTQQANGTFDIVIADWTNATLTMFRVGGGDSREFSIVV